MSGDNDSNWWQKRTLIPFSSPSLILLSGSTMSGKTTLIYEILKNSRGMFEITPTKIIIAYGEWQPLFDKMEENVPNITFHQGLPSRDNIEQWSTNSEHTVLVIDDLIAQVTKSEDTAYLFCVTAHHRRVTVMLLTQNLYMPGKNSRTISLQCQYVILFRNVRDARQIMTFGSQVFPGKLRYFKDAYIKSTAKPYGYLVVDQTPCLPEQYRLRTNILPNQDTTLFVPKM